MAQVHRPSTLTRESILANVASEAERVFASMRGSGVVYSISWGDSKRSRWLCLRWTEAAPRCLELVSYGLTTTPNRANPTGALSVEVCATIVLSQTEVTKIAQWLLEGCTACGLFADVYTMRQIFRSREAARELALAVVSSRWPSVSPIHSLLTTIPPSAVETEEASLQYVETLSALAGADVDLASLETNEERIRSCARAQLHLRESLSMLPLGRCDAPTPSEVEAILRSIEAPSVGVFFPSEGRGHRKAGSSENALWTVRWVTEVEAGFVISVRSGEGAPSLINRGKVLLSSAVVTQACSERPLNVGETVESAAEESCTFARELVRDGTLALVVEALFIAPGSDSVRIRLLRLINSYEDGKTDEYNEMFQGVSTRSVARLCVAVDSLAPTSVDLPNEKISSVRDCVHAIWRRRLELSELLGFAFTDV
jgi:hypothetical protein